MKSKIKIDKIIRRMFLILALALLVCLVCPSGAKMTVHANEQAFNIDLKMLPLGGNTFDFRLTVENTGEDWEGTVRLMMGSYYGTYNDYAYDTVLTLPQGSTKQFVVRVPMESIYTSNEEIQVTLLDKNSNVTADKVFKRFLNEGADALTMGILSDSYSELTFLDMGGLGIDYHYSKDYPIKLTKINKDNLSDSLDALTFLVIDTYNTGVLTDDEISDIEKWTDDGGVLIIGTGSYAGDTLRGFDYLGVECKKVYSPGENPHSYSSDYVDWSQLNMAELVCSKSQYYCDDYSSLVVTKPQGYGAVGILPYALTELGRLDASDYNQYCTQSEFVRNFLGYACVMANENYENAYSYKCDNRDTLCRILNELGNSSVILNFGVLKFIVIVYVIIAGPVLYIVLRSIKKRGLYWAAVPATALVGIFLVFFAGRGFEVENTRVFSVTVYNLSERGDCTTYLHCYDAGHREWALRLAEGYEYVGPLVSDSFTNGDTYYYHIRKEGDRLFFGINPSSGFEDSYLCAGRAMNAREADGSIESDGSPTSPVGPALKWRLVDVSGTVTNNTNYDFAYFAVVKDDSLQLYKSLPAGETCSLTKDEMVFYASQISYYYHSDYNSNIKEYVEKDNLEKDNLNAIYALGVGISSAYQQMDTGATAIVGVVPDWDKAVDDNCSETSYGCFYIIQ